MMDLDWEQLDRAFTALLGEGRAYRDSESLQACSTDETGERICPPDLVLKPKSVAEVSAIMKKCSAEGIPVTPRGGGSGVSGGALPVRGGISLCLERLDRVLSIDPRNMTLEVECGAITGEVQKQLLSQGLCLPPDPGSKDWCQIGGNLAEMAAGPKSVKYGAFKDYVLNLEVVLPDGEIINTGANVRKCASGYNLTQLMLGSEGTLGIITRVVFKILPAPTEEILLRVGFPDLESAGEMICRVFESGLAPSELEFIDRDGIKKAAPLCAEKPDPNVAAYLWLGFDGVNADLLMEDAERAAELAESLGGGEVLIAEEPEHKARLWEYRHKIGHAIIESTRFRDVDACFPRARLRDMVTGVKEIAEKHGFETVCFGHCGDGNLHIQVLRGALDDAAWNGPVQQGIREIYALSCELGGALSGEHGVGLILPEHLDLMYSKRQLALMQGIKSVFDPKGILNPGKIFPK